MIRNDQWLRDHAAQLGINPEHINPASVDVCLGQHVIEYTVVQSEDQWTTHERVIELQPGQEMVFLPGRFYLCHTEEYTTIPTDHCAQLILKSSSGRKGLDHAHSGWGDPGFHGQWTFEFVAHKPATFKQGQRIAQLIFMRCDEPLKDYTITGRYNGQTNVQEALEDGHYATDTEQAPTIPRGVEEDLDTLLGESKSPF